MRALSFHQVESLLRAGGSEYGHAHCARELNRSGAHAAAGTMNQQSFTRPCMCVMMQCGECCAIGNPDSRTLRKRNLIRQRVRLRFQHQRVFRICPAHRSRGVDARAWLHFGYPLADGLDNARGVGPRRIRQRRFDRIRAVAHVRVIRIDARAVHANQKPVPDQALESEFPRTAILRGRRTGALESLSLEFSQGRVN